MTDPDRISQDPTQWQALRITWLSIQKKAMLLLIFLYVDEIDNETCKIETVENRLIKMCCIIQDL